MSEPTAPLTREKILEAFELLSARLGENGIRGEICIIGGACMVLAFNARATTKDVDTIATPPGEVLRQAFRIGQELNLPDGWLNNAARLFISKKNHEVRDFNVQYPHLHLLVPTAPYMLAMKCLAARIGAVDDRSDIKFLIKHLDLKSLEEVKGVIENYYPPEHIKERAHEIIEAVLSDLENEHGTQKEGFNGR